MLAEGGAVDLTAAEGRWTRVAANGSPGEGKGKLVWCSGAIDPHINGWGGCDFLRDDPAQHGASLRALCAAGVTGFLPTLITCAEEALA